MYDKNYEEYMSTVLGYNINQENTYCNYDYDNFSYDLEKNYFLFQYYIHNHK